MLSLKHRVLQGLPRDGSQQLGEQVVSQQQEPEDPLESMRIMLKWQAQDNFEATLTGRTLLYYATLANEPEPVRLILEHQRTVSINVVLTKPDLVIGQVSTTPLINSMMYAYL